MDAPPLNPAVKLMEVLPFPGVATKFVGALGVVAGVTLTEDEATPEP